MKISTEYQNIYLSRKFLLSSFMSAIFLAQIVFENFYTILIHCFYILPSIKEKYFPFLVKIFKIVKKLIYLNL